LPIKKFLIDSLDADIFVTGPAVTLFGR